MDSSEDDDAGERQNFRIKSVSLTVEVLRQIAANGGPIGVTELARRMGESKARIHRHLITLRADGLLSQEASEDRYRLGWVLFELGQAAAAQFEISEIATPSLRALCASTRLTVLLGQRAGNEVIVSHTYESENAIAVTAKRGLRLPAHSSAAGRVMLAFSSKEDQNRMLAGPLPKATAKTMANKPEIMRRLVQVRERGYDFASSESQSGVNALAAGIFSGPNQLAATVSVIGTELQVPLPPKEKLLKQVLECAREISKAITR